MSSSLSKWKAEKWGHEWALCTFTISKSSSHITEVTQMSLFHSFPISVIFVFLFTNILIAFGRGGRAVLEASFDSQLQFLEKKKKENKKPIRPVCCSELFLLISEDCDVEGRVSSSPQLGLLRDIRHGG